MDRLDADAAIACSLNDQEFRDRRALVRRTLLGHVNGFKRNGDTLTLQFEEGEKFRADLEHFVSLERQCCGFLTFAISDAPRNELQISGPPGASATIDMFAAAIERGA